METVVELKKNWQVGDTFVVSESTPNAVRMIIQANDTNSIGSLIFRNGKTYYTEDNIKNVNTFMETHYSNAIKVVQEEPSKFKQA